MNDTIQNANGQTVPKDGVRKQQVASTIGPLCYRASKRGLDLVSSGAALLLLSPVFALIALIIKLEDAGPVFFKQKRVGKGGQTFDFFKFRSMCADAEAKRAALLAESDTLRFKLEHDPRITWIGRFLRRFSLDELPQLLNVFRGDMTLVGPRPPIPEEVAKYDRHAMRRLEVEQGLTCIWQVSGRSLIPFDGQVAMDIEYIEQRSLRVDLAILFRTIPAVLTGRGAY